jgi:predicted ATPase
MLNAISWIGFKSFREAELELGSLNVLIGSNGAGKPMTAPSKRILSLCGDYNKPLLGILIAEAIGLPMLREKCSHFNQRLTSLESNTESHSLNSEADSSTKEHQ